MAYAMGFAALGLIAPAPVLADTMQNEAAKPAGDIVDVAAQAGTFKTLLAAATAAGLVETLKSPGPFTIFAPTDAAFAKLPEGTVANLLKPENKETLARILKHHVVAGKVMAKDIAGKKMMVETAAGTKLDVDATSNVRVGGATVTAADIAASNGVIHVIDSVVLPE
jgi:uncharacterized surface protein with fasciclin (FAS1) repeats